MPARSIAKEPDPPLPTDAEIATLGVRRGLGDVIEVTSGLRPRDRVILSDMSQYGGAAAIVLR
jgi:hypothetical protein